MEKFRKFELNKQQFIFGGNEQCTEWTRGAEAGCDDIDTETGEITYGCEV